MRALKQTTRLVTSSIKILIFCLFFSTAWAEDEHKISLSIISGVSSESIRVGGLFEKIKESRLYSLSVTGFNRVFIEEEYEVPLQEKPEFEIILNPSLSYSLQITEYDGYGNKLSVSEELDGITLSHFMDFSERFQSKQQEQTLRRSLGKTTGLNIHLKNVSCEAFPSVSIDAEITRDGKVISDANNFSILENGLVPSSSISILPPKSGGSKRTADFVFVFDHSRSMDNDLIRLQSSIIDFVTELKKTNIEYNLAFVPYERNPRIEQTFTSDANEFLQSIQNFLDHWPGGSTENAFKALETSITSLAWRPGAQKVLILFTDEDDDFGGPSLSSVNNTLTSANATVYGVVKQSSGNSNAHFCATGSVTDVTGGRCYAIATPNFNNILNDITTTVGASYLIRYDSSDTSSANEVRAIELSVDQENETAIATTAYNFSQCGNQLDILIAKDTLKLGDSAHRQFQTVDIKAIIKSIDSTLPITSKLFYRQAGSNINYQSVTMQFEGNNSYKGVIPKQAVVEPGIEYYIQASNTKKTITFPATKAEKNPLTIGVLPNQLPVIIHTPVSSVALNKEIVITAKVTDDTNQLQSVKLYYRNKGILYTYKSIEMLNTTGNEYQAVIPSSEILGNEIDYYIQAVDDFGMPRLSGIPFISPHRIIVSRGVFGSVCEVVNSTIKVCGDSKKVVGDISTISGNVTIGHADNSKPLLGVETAVDVDLQNFTVKTKGSGDVLALGFKRNIQKDPEDFILFAGGFDIDAVSMLLTPHNIRKNVGLFGSELSFGWPLLGGGEVLIDKETLELRGLLLSFVNYTNLININVPGVSREIKLLDLPKVKIDQQGKDTTAAITLTSDLFGVAGATIGLSESLKVVEPEITIDLVKQSLSLKGKFSIGKIIKKLPDIGITVGAGFLFDPAVAVDSLTLGLTLNEPSKGSYNVWSFPPSPPSAVGIAPTGGTIRVDNIAKSQKGNREATYTLTLDGAVVSSTYTQRYWKVLDGEWPLSGSMTGSLEPSTGSFKFNADMKVLERYTLAQVLLELNYSANNPSLQLGAVASFPSEKEAWIQGKLDISLSSNNTTGVFSANGGLGGTLHVPDYTDFIGGMTLANVNFDYDYLLKKISSERSRTEKSLISLLVKVLWADFRVSYDFVSNNFRASKSLYTSALGSSVNARLSVSGYNSGSIKRVLSKQRQRGAENLSVSITESSDVVLLKISSTQSSAIFDLEIPDGSIYKTEDATLDPASLLANVAFFRSNQVANESYWALKAPSLGEYKIKMKNSSDVGDFQVSVLYQNIKPTIQLTSLFSDINVQAGDKVKITWDATDPDNNAEISLYYATDKLKHNGKIIMSGLHEDTDSEFEWIVPEGVYGSVYIYVVIDDGNLGRITKYSQGQIIFPDSPAPSSPLNVLVTAGDGAATVLWDLNDTTEKVTAYRLNIREIGKQTINTLVVYGNTYTFKNLGNGVMYEIAVNAINSEGFVSSQSPWVSVTPLGSSIDGPSDLIIPQGDIVAVLDGTTVKVNVNIENISNYEAYSYQLACWVDKQDKQHLIGKIKGLNLAGQSVKSHNFQFDALTFPKPIGETIICRVSDVSIEELNTANNGTINSQALKGLLTIPGDANADGKINSQDLIKIINHILGIETANGNPDCNSDGSVNSLDTVCIINKILGK